MTVPAVSLCAGGPVLSQIVYGAWRLHDGPEPARPAAVARLIEECLELGITSFDHADIYGGYRCEALFGEALASCAVPRARIQLISKCDICLPLPARPEHRIKHYDTSARHIERSVERSLSNLRTDHLDLLLLHRPDPLLDADETAGAVHRLLEQGKIRHIGVSNFRPHQLSLLAARLGVPVCTNQIEVSPLAIGAFTDGTLDQCQERRIRPMGWSPLAGGRLLSGSDPAAQRVRLVLEAQAQARGATVDQIALSWLLRHPAGIVPVIGTCRPERVRSAVAALRFPLERQDWFAIYSAALGGDVP